MLLDVETLVAVEREEVLDGHDPELLVVAIEKILLEHGTRRTDSCNLANLGILKEIQDHLLNGLLYVWIHYK